MSITRQTIKRLERELNKSRERDYLVIPLFATPAEAEAIRDRGKREDREVIGEPLHDYTNKEII